jgi:hypothetical protein
MYLSKFEKIPAPDFIVLYNGKEPYPDRDTLRLSDAFRDVCDLPGAGNAAPSLELVVQVYNINHGHNMEILEKSRNLGDYSIFVDRMREYALTLPLDEAMRKAVKYCIDNNILKIFLETHSTEVINMLLTEWNLEEAKVAWYEEGREERDMEIVRNAFVKGIPLKMIHEITGLKMEVIQNIQAGLIKDEG